MINTIEYLSEMIETQTELAKELEGDELLEKMETIENLQRRLEKQICIEKELRLEADADETIRWERKIKEKELSIETLKCMNPINGLGHVFNRLNLSSIMKFEKDGETISKSLLPWVKPKN